MGKIIVITGTGRGLGRAMTEGFIQGGHTVLGCTRSDATVEKLNQQFGAPNDFTALDVADDAQEKLGVTTPS